MLAAFSVYEMQVLFISPCCHFLIKVLVHFNIPNVYLLRRIIIDFFHQYMTCFLFLTCSADLFYLMNFFQRPLEAKRLLIY